MARQLPRGARPSDRSPIVWKHITRFVIRLHSAQCRKSTLH